MATYCVNCNPGLTDICDFCAFYNFNPEWRKFENEIWQPIYVEEGFCYVDMLPYDPIDTCDEFYCFQIKEYGRKTLCQK